MGLVNTGASLGGMAGGANTARLMVVISGNTQGLQSALAGATAEVQGFSNKVNAMKANSHAIGNALIRGISLPAMAVGGAALKMAMDYEAAMGRVAGLTTLRANEVEQAYGRILQMSTEVGVAPVELANSLYFAGSAGLHFEEAMQVVEASALGAAIGMGEAADLSKILIFALNNYRDTGLTAARAMDVFSAAIKQGTADPDELALALGRVLPVAKEVGVTFDTTVASIAALTNLGLPTRVAATSLRALFGGLLAPTKQATEALAEFGITTEQLRDAVDAGPLVAFKMLEDAVGGNEDMMRKIIPQIRAFTAYLGLSGEQMKRSAKVFDEVRNSAGAFEKAVARIQKTRKFQFAIALEELRVAGVKMGTALFPIFEKLIGIIGGFGSILGGFGDVGQGMIATLVLMAAALGPLVKLYAVLTNQGQGLFTSFRAGAAAAGVFAASSLILVGSMKSVSENGLSMTSALMLAVSGFAVAKIAAEALALGLARVGAASAAMNVALLANPIALALSATALAIGVLVHKAGAAERSVKALGTAFRGFGSDTVISATALRDLEGSLNAVELDLFRDAVQKARVNGKQFGESIGDIRAEVKKEMAAIEATMSAHEKRIEGGWLDWLGTNEEETQLDALAEIDKALGDTSVSFEQQVKDKIALFGREGEAVEAMAGKYGVSTDYLESVLGEVGTAAHELSGDTEQAFAEQVGFVDKGTGEMIAALQEQQAAEEKFIAERQESLRADVLGRFFEGNIEKVKRSTAAIIAATTKQTQAMVTMAGDINTLRMRGLDPGALQLLVDQGPAMVGKFVEASDKELQKFEDNYHMTLGAVDAAILNEGDHQEIKGKKIVGQFSEGMLSNSKLPVAASTRIVGAVVSAYQAGDIGDAGVEFITTFADRMEAMNHLPKKAATSIMDQVVSAVKAGKIKDASIEQIWSMARAWVDNADIPKDAAGFVVEDIVRVLRASSSRTNGAGGLAVRGYADGIMGAAGVAQAAGLLIAEKTKKSFSFSAYDIGFKVGGTFASGLVDGWAMAGRELVGLTDQTKTKVKDGMKGSPKYFTYYVGQDLVKQLNEGMGTVSVTGMGRPGIGRGRRFAMAGAGKSKDRRDGGPVEIRGRLVLAGGDAYIEGVAVDVVEGNASRQSGHSRLRRRKAVD